MYKLTQYSSILKIDGNAVMCIPADPANSDWQEYQAWLALGNEPEPAE